MKVKLSGSLSHRTGWSRGVSEAECALMTLSAEQGEGAVIPGYSPQPRALINWASVVEYWTPNVTPTKIFATSSHSWTWNGRVIHEGAVLLLCCRWFNILMKLYMLQLCNVILHLYSSPTSPILPILPIYCFTGPHTLIKYSDGLVWLQWKMLRNMYIKLECYGYR